MTWYTPQTQNELIAHLGNNSLTVLDFYSYKNTQDDLPPVTLAGHTEAVLSVAVLPNGQVVSGSWDETLRVWDISRGTCIKVLKGHTSGVRRVAVLSNGKVISASVDGTLRVWDINSGVCVKVLKGHTDTVYGVSALPNGQAVSGSWDKTLRVWDINRGVCVKVLKGHTNWVGGLAVLPNSQVISAGFDQTLRVWNINSGVCVKVLTGHTNCVQSVAVLTDGQVVSASTDKTLRVWNISSGVCVKVLTGHTGHVIDVAVLPNGHVVSASEDKTLRVWDINSGVCVKVLDGHVHGIAALTNGQVVSASEDKTLKIWTPFPPLSYEMIAPVLTAIEPFSGLNKLSCRGVNLGEAGYQHILHLIKTIPTLEMIDVSDAGLTVHQENEIQQALRERHSAAVNAPINLGSQLAPIVAPILAQPALLQPLQLAPQLSISHDEVTKGQTIGRGGFGTVYKATWQHTPVALKELDIRNQLGAELLNDFRYEADIMTHLRHPRIVSLFGATFTPPYWLVLELMSKGALSTLLYSLEVIDWPLRIHLAQQIVEGLAYLHSKGIIHQDLKSMNILLDEHNQAKIADFGLAKLKVKSQTSSLHSNPTGTLAWIAPEILTQEKGASAETDMFSYGMILWELAARKAPYENAGNAALIIAWAIQGKFPAIPEETPTAFRQLIEGCRSAPGTRLTANAVLAQLAGWTTPLPQHVLPPSYNEEIKDESPIPNNYQGGLASGSFALNSIVIQNSQPFPSVRGTSQEYRGAFFSNRGGISQTTGRGQTSATKPITASRGRASLTPQRGTRPSSQGSCRHQ